MLTTSYTFSYDESKPNIVCIVPIKRYSYIFGFINIILDELSQKYLLMPIVTQRKNMMKNIPIQSYIILTIIGIYFIKNLKNTSQS